MMMIVCVCVCVCACVCVRMCVCVCVCLFLHRICEIYIITITYVNDFLLPHRDGHDDYLQDILIHLQSNKINS